jgi:mono/diheme cytochrome c family protein
VRLLLAAALVALAGRVEAADRPEAAVLEQGGAVFQKWCAPCHAAGPGHPGTQALHAKYGPAKPDALEQRLDLTPETVRFYVRHGVSVMPFFRKTEITDADLDALGAYLARKKHD